MQFSRNNPSGEPDGKPPRNTLLSALPLERDKPENIAQRTYRLVSGAESLALPGLAVNPVAVLVRRLLGP
jgi:hypothetical protein